MKAKYCSNVQCPYAAGHPNRIDKLRVLKIAKNGKTNAVGLLCWCYSATDDNTVIDTIIIIYDYCGTFVCLSRSQTVTHPIDSNAYHKNYYWFAIRSQQLTINLYRHWLKYHWLSAIELAWNAAPADCPASLFFIGLWHVLRSIIDDNNRKLTPHAPQNDITLFNQYRLQPAYGYSVFSDNPLLPTNHENSNQNFLKYLWYEREFFHVFISYSVDYGSWFVGNFGNPDSITSSFQPRYNTFD